MSIATVLEMSKTHYCCQRDNIYVNKLAFLGFWLMKNSQVPSAATDGSAALIRAELVRLMLVKFVAFVSAAFFYMTI